MCWKLLNDKMFSEVRFTLDNMMKMHTAQGIGTSIKQAELLSSSDKDLLWGLGLLGYHSAETLLNTVVFMIRKGFTL